MSHVVVIYTVSGNSYTSIPYSDEDIKSIEEAMWWLADVKSIAIDCKVTESGTETFKKVFNPRNIEHMFIKEMKL